MHTRVASRETTGMAMALELRRLVPGVESELALIAGYESGHVVVLCNHGEKQWDTAYVLKPHSQPILSLAVYPDNSSFLTTSADSLIVRHPLGEGRVKVVDTRHLGLQGVSVRSDGKVFATAGWDGRFRVFSGKGMKELAVLKWHGVGCYAVAFAEILEEEGEGEVVDGGSSCDSALSGPREARPDGELARLSVTDSRIRRESRRHWIAGGAKDGKVSLWEIY